MEHTVLSFVVAARSAGMRISTAEVLDCLELLPRIDVLDEAQLATLLRSSFAKSRLEQARFDRLYHLFFHELCENLDESAESLKEPMEAFRQAWLDRERELPQAEAIAAFLVGEPEAYLQLMEESRTEGPEEGTPQRGFGANLGSLVKRLPVMEALYRTEELIEAFLSQPPGGLAEETSRELDRHLRQRLESARRLLTDEPRFVDSSERVRPTSAVYGELGGKPFANLSPRELQRVRDAIAALVRKLEDVLRLRRAARARGVLDVKRTLRAAMRTQGVPMELKFRQRLPRKSRLLVLCDVSGSVWGSARFMLTLLYALQDAFERVRSFVFIDAPVEVSHLFEDHDIEGALARIFTHPEVGFGAPTDYGRLLRLFRERHLDLVDKKTTVIVIGDGRSNYGNAEAGILEVIRDRSRRLLWLTPEAEELWGSGDSEIHTYEALCNELRTCRNLNELSAFIEDLVL